MNHDIIVEDLTNTDLKTRNTAWVASGQIVAKTLPDALSSQKQKLPTDRPLSIHQITQIQQEQSGQSDYLLGRDLATVKDTPNLYLYLHWIRSVLLLLILLAILASGRMVIHYYYYSGFSQANQSLQRTSISNMVNPSLFHLVTTSVLNAVSMIIVLVAAHIYYVRMQLQQDQLTGIAHIRYKALAVSSYQKSTIAQLGVHAVHIVDYRARLESLLVQHTVDSLLTDLTIPLSDGVEYTQFCSILHFKEQQHRQQYLKLHAHQVVIKDLPEPIATNWENLFQTISTKNVAISILLVLLGLTITGFAVNISQVAYVQLTTNCFLYARNIPIASVTSNSTDPNIAYCYCMENFPSAQAPCIDSRNYTWYFVALYLFLQPGGAIVCGLTNRVLAAMVSKMIENCRLFDENKKNRIKFSVVFIVAMVNTLFAPFVISLQIGSTRPADLFVWILGTTNKYSSYTQFNRNWNALQFPFWMMILFIAITDAPVELLFTFIFQKCNKKPRLAKMKLDCEIYMAINCVYLSITLILSALYPVLIIMGVFLMLANYLSHKYLIIRFSVEESRCAVLTDYKPYLVLTLILNQLVAIWGLTCPQIITDPSVLNSFSLASLTQYTPGNRMLAFSHMVALLVLLVVYLCWDLYMMAAGPLVSNSQQGSKIEPTGQSLSQSYNPLMNPRYSNLWRILQIENHQP